MTTPNSSAHLSSFTTPSLQTMPPESSKIAAAVCTPTAAVVTETEIKIKKPRCEHTGCRAKLGLLGFKCKCTGKYCGAHRHPDQHDCAYNFRAAAEAQLKKQLVMCIGDKLGGDRV
jgi:hypothetical protein